MIIPEGGRKEKQNHTLRPYCRKQTTFFVDVIATCNISHRHDVNILLNVVSFCSFHEIKQKKPQKYFGRIHSYSIVKLECDFHKIDCKNQISLFTKYLVQVTHNCDFVTFEKGLCSQLSHAR